MRRLVLLLLALWAGLADRTVLPGLLEGGQPAMPASRDFH